jgi:hypothetical protein
VHEGIVASLATFEATSPALSPPVSASPETDASRRRGRSDRREVDRPGLLGIDAL